MHPRRMRSTWVLLWCLVAAVAVPVTAGAEDGAGENPSLEYRPPRLVVPEPKAPTPAPPVAIFREALGGFGISSGAFDGPVDVAFGRDGGLYVLDSGNGRVQRFDSFGNFVSTWGSSGSRPGEFRDPMALAVDAEGSVYVADTGNHRIQKFDAEGKFLLLWGSLGSRSGDFKSPNDLVFDGDGTLWVVDSGNERIQQFDQAGKHLREWGRAFGSRGGVFSDLVSIAWSDERFGYIYLLGAECLVQQFERDGTLVTSWSGLTPESAVCVPGRLESDNRDDALYFVDAGNGLVVKFNREGRYLTSLRGAASPFSRPQGLAVNPERGDFAVADTGNDLVQKFTLR